MEIDVKEFDKEFMSYVGHVARRFRLDPEDLFQEIALNIIKSDGPRDVDNPGPWKRTVARNTAIAMIRLRKWRQSGTIIDESVTDSHPSPVANAIKSERAEMLVENVRLLSDLDFRTLNDYYYHGKSIKEMAEEEDAPIGTIKRRLHVARRRLEEKLTEKYGEPE